MTPCYHCGIPTSYMKIDTNWCYCELCWQKLIPSYGAGYPTIDGIEQRADKWQPVHVE